MYFFKKKKKIVETSVPAAQLLSDKELKLGCRLD
jgi:hypothetical protein